MKATVHQTVCTLLAALSLVLPANSHAQTNPPKLEISACACRGPDPGHGPLSIGAEYRITLFVTNTGASEIFFQEVQGAFGAARGGVLTQRTTGRKETMTLKPGQGQVYFFPTDSYTSELLANSGSASLLFQATFLDEHSNVLASSEATLPRLEELPLDNSFDAFLPTRSVRGAKLALTVLSGTVLAEAGPSVERPAPPPDQATPPPGQPAPPPGWAATAPALTPERRAAAEAGDSTAQLDLGRAYAQGKGVPQDKAEAYKWYRRSGEQSNVQGQVQVAYCFTDGFGVAKDDAEAAKWYRKAAEQGHPIAQLDLGFAYQLGKGVPKDPVEGVKWYRRAAEQGQADAQSNLGYCYINGDGVPQDYKEGVRWYRKAAEQDSAEAQASLAMCYRLGQGVAQDDQEAAHWDRLAAEQGNPRAQDNLAVSYLLGSGVERDPIEAYKWLTLAAAQGYQRAEIQRSQVIKDFRLTPEGIAEGERRAREFAPKSARAGIGPTAPPQGPRTAGSGFFITEDGYLLTCYHVVAYAARLEVKTSGGVVAATLVKADPVNDLAILKVAGSVRALAMTPSRAVKLGQLVFTIGFPNPDWQGIQPKLTRGEISSLAGMRDDPRQFQISVATQPGNSGGALVDEQGNVVGVVVMQANDAAVLRTSGALPQNVNYAIKSAYALALIEAVPEVAARLKSPQPKSRPPEQVVEQTESATALILAY